MSNLTIRVNKTYRTRLGTQVKIVDSDSGANGEIYISEDGVRYFDDGNPTTIGMEDISVNTTEFIYNNALIEEIDGKEDSAKTFKIELGKYYKTKAGAVFKVIRQLDERRRLIYGDVLDHGKEVYEAMSLHEVGKVYMFDEDGKFRNPYTPDIVAYASDDYDLVSAGGE